MKTYHTLSLMIPVCLVACDAIKDPAPDGSGGSGGSPASSVESSSSAASSSSGEACVPVPQATACEGSECGFKSDKCGGAWWCGAQFSPFCDAEGKLLCLSSAAVAGKCSPVGECMHLTDADQYCPGGAEMVACNGSDGWAPGKCAKDTGVCAPYAGKTLDFYKDVILSCCSPCQAP